MPGVWSCSQQHRWQPASTDSATLDAVQTCPVCGLPGELVDSAVDTPGGHQTVTLGNHARPVPASEVRVAGYEVVGEVGRGAMGVVYKARHLALNRLVALKMILAGTHAGPHDVARFRREVETFAVLRHPNIVQIYEVGDADGLPYCALEFVEGGTLSQRLKAGPRDPADAARLIATLARAVHSAHERGVIHRDLKPGNVLLTDDGQPKIADFGLAKLLGSTSSLTGSSSVLGTPAYMAPEQADGQARAITPAADVYSLGAILYECLTGRPPFKAGSALETLQQVLHEEPAPPHRRRASVPRDLETICLKCLEKDPARRYATAGALADDLERYLAGEAVRARPVGWAGRVWRWGRRHRAALTGAALATAATLLVVALWPEDPTGPHAANHGSGQQTSSQSGAQEDAELLVRVTTPSGEHTGPGSLYSEKGVVLTNCELLGMATKDSPPPSKVEVVYHPGKPDERTYAADVISVEPAVNVAVLKLRGESLPEPRPPTALAQAPPSPTGLREVVKGTPPPDRSNKVADAVERAQKAAVLIRAARGAEHWLGSGFFAGAPGVVVTAPQVLALRETAQPAPDTIEVVVEPGTPGERILPARLLGLDRDNDLAVLRVDPDQAGARSLPDPLVRAPQEETAQGSRLFALGFPAEVGLLRRSTAASRPALPPRPRPAALARRVLTRQGGVRILQLEGGAEPGNAGCAVIDADGRYVGMVVTDLPGTRIQFAAPAAYVTRLLEGRVLSLQPGPAYTAAPDAVLPITARLVDPLGRVGKLALIAWAGPPGTLRPSSGTTPPAPERGDDPARTFALRVTDDAVPPGEGRIAVGEIMLPRVPNGKVLWVRPRYTDVDGAERWGEAFTLSRPAARYEREPVALHDKIDGPGRVALRWHIVERGAGRTVQQPEAKIELAESSRPAGPRAGQAARALAALALPLPGREVRPGDTWDGTVLIRSEGLTVKAEAEVSLAVQYRYLGRGTRAGREEALVELSGRPASGQDAIGEVFGYALIETTTGRVTLARAHFDVSAPATLPDKTSARVHFSLQAALARAAGTEGPGPDIDLSALPPDHSMILPVFVR